MLTAEQTEKLIELVKENSSLYDPGHHQYQNTFKKRQIWLDIGKEMNVSAFECKSRWNNLRDMYRKCLFGKSTAPCRYKYGAQLSFLKKVFNIETEEEEPGTSKEDSNNPTFCDVSLNSSDIKTESNYETEIYPEFQSVKEVNPLNGEVHPVDAFLAGISPTLKTLSPIDLSLAKLEIFQVVHKYEMKTLKESTII